MYAWKMYILPKYLPPFKPTEINSSIKLWQWASNDNGKVKKQEFSGIADDCFKNLKQNAVIF